jgi:hypothetical protein
MSNLKFLLVFCVLFIQVGCGEKESLGEPPCDGSCLFTLKSASGTIVKLACFNRFAIKAIDPDTNQTIFGIPDNLDPQFEVEGKTVIFSGSFRPNMIEPNFPDPDISPGSIFQLSIADIH